MKGKGFKDAAQFSWQEVFKLGRRVLSPGSGGNVLTISHSVAWEEGLASARAGYVNVL